MLIRTVQYEDCLYWDMLTWLILWHHIISLLPVGFFFFFLKLHLKASSSFKLCSDLSWCSFPKFEFLCLFPSPSFLYPILFCWISPTYSFKFFYRVAFFEKGFSFLLNLGCIFCLRCSLVIYCFLCLNIVYMLTLYCTHLLTYQTMFSMHIEIMAVLFLTVSLQPVTGWHKIMDTQY